jgi:hypothetical protein
MIFKQSVLASERVSCIRPFLNKNGNSSVKNLAEDRCTFYFFAITAKAVTPKEDTQMGKW